MTAEHPVLVDTLAAAAAVGRPAGTVRRWANEGRIVRQGTDKKGRTVYRLEDVYRAAANLRYGRGPVTSVRPR